MPPITTIFMAVSVHATAAYVNPGGNMLVTTDSAHVYPPDHRACAKVAQKIVFKIDRFTQIDCATGRNTG